MPKTDDFFNIVNKMKDDFVGEIRVINNNMNAMEIRILERFDKYNEKNDARYALKSDLKDLKDKVNTDEVKIDELEKAKNKAIGILAGLNALGILAMIAIKFLKF